MWYIGNQDTHSLWGVTRLGKLIMIGGPFLITSEDAFLFLGVFFHNLSSLQNVFSSKRDRHLHALNGKKLPINPN